jgi:lipopolysaccharide/colanic/teichoic acid biosynthesis glycosyltransferase
MKRIFDIVLCLLLVVPLVVSLLIIGMAVWSYDKGPVLYRQTRVGRGGLPFKILKFRTMVINADQIGSFSTAENDQRITKMGAFFRKTSLDELPQILNVLKGDMSWVGPRPDVPAQQDLYTEEDWKLRCSVRPGITGLAQASGRSSLDAETRTKLDLAYARNPSLEQDIRILVKTLAVVFNGA